VPSGADFKVDLTQDQVNAIQAQIEQQTRKAQADAMASLWQRLYDVVHKMAEVRGTPISLKGYSKFQFYD
jgi:hypothetical protein